MKIFHLYDAMGWWSTAYDAGLDHIGGIRALLVVHPTQPNPTRSSHERLRRELVIGAEHDTVAAYGIFVIFLKKG